MELTETKADPPVPEPEPEPTPTPEPPDDDEAYFKQRDTAMEEFHRVQRTLKRMGLV